LKANGIGQSKDSAAAQPLLISIQINNKEMGGEIGAGLGTDGRSAASALAGGTEAAASGSEAELTTSSLPLIEHAAKPLDWDLD